MNVRGFFAISSIILLSLVSSGCKEKSAPDSQYPTEGTDAATRSRSAETTETGTGIALDKTRPIPGDDEQKQIALLPARTFQSDIPFRVFAHRTHEELFEWDGFMRGATVGETEPGQTVQIPQCHVWFVTPIGPSPDWQKVAAEVAQRNIPGLRISGGTDVDLSHLASLRHLIYLAVSESDDVTDAALKHVENLTNLQMLILSGCDNLSDSALEHLENLESMQMLFLNCTRFTGGGLEHLKNLKDLRVLWADYNNTEPRLEHLKELEKLQVLILMEARTTDAGLGHLKTLKNLERLALESANITDAGLKHLEALKKLKMLYFDSAQCTDAAVESLRKALPKCQVAGQ